MADRKPKPSKEQQVVDLRQFAAHYIEQLRGPDAQDAFFSLIEADAAVVPLLIDAFKIEQDAGMRAALVEVIWQHRLPETISFLSEALADSDAAVWKEALDGLVALAGTAAIEALESARDRILPHDPKGTVQVDWIDEAIQQIRREKF
jgi:hypothetical protein